MAELLCSLCAGIADPGCSVACCEPCADKMPLRRSGRMAYFAAIDRLYEVHGPGAEILDWLERKVDAYEDGPMLRQLLDILVPRSPHE